MIALADLPNTRIRVFRERERERVFGGVLEALIERHLKQSLSLFPHLFPLLGIIDYIYLETCIAKEKLRP